MGDPDRGLRRRRVSRGRAPVVRGAALSPSRQLVHILAGDLGPPLVPLPNTLVKATVGASPCVRGVVAGSRGAPRAPG